MQELLAVEGLGEAGAAALKSVQAAALRLMRAEVIDQPVLTNWDRLMAYLNAELSRERVEQFRVLFLDNRNRLLADEAQQRGTVNHTPVYPREVAKRALELHATALILVHNHPSGDPTPSAEDIAMTREIKAATGGTVDRAARPCHRRQRTLAELPNGGAAVALSPSWPGGNRRPRAPHRPVARQRDAVHDAALAMVVIHRIVLRAAIVPDRQRPAPPSGSGR